MSSASEGEDSTDSALSRLRRRAKVIDVLTFLAVVLISPASVVFSIPLGVAPEVWLDVWTTYVIAIILVAMGIGVLGFGISTHYKLQADRLNPKTV